MINKYTGAYFFLSNFHACRVLLDEEWYPSVEHAYQAAKTLNLRQRKEIQGLGYKRSNVAKMLGKTVTLRPDWDILRLPVMRGLLVQKFYYPWFHTHLQATGNEELLEGNTWHDNFWGSCHCAQCGNKGENHLGRYQMEIRAEQRLVR